MNTEKTIDVLNKLVEINNDRIEGYETASSETEEIELKNLFAQFAHTSHRCKMELESEITRLGGEPVEGTKITGKFFRVWMDFKSALTNRDRKAILSSCEFGEDKAVETYEDVLKNNLEHLSFQQQTMINSQYALIKTDHNRVKSMRDSLVTSNR